MDDLRQVRELLAKHEFRIVVMQEKVDACLIDYPPIRVEPQLAAFQCRYEIRRGLENFLLFTSENGDYSLKCPEHALRPLIISSIINTCRVNGYPTGIVESYKLDGTKVDDTFFLFESPSSYFERRKESLLSEIAMKCLEPDVNWADFETLAEQSGVTEGFVLLKEVFGGKDEQGSLTR